MLKNVVHNVVISKDEPTIESPCVNAYDVLSKIIPHDLLLQAFVEAEMLASNDILITASVRSDNPKCLLIKLILHIRYDFINDVIRRVTLEVWISSDITVKDLFEKIGNIIKEFNGSFELAKDYVKIYFNIQLSKLSSIIHLLNVLFNELLCINSSLVINEYKVLVDY